MARFAAPFFLIAIALVSCSSSVKNDDADSVASSIQGGLPSNDEPAVGMLLFDDGGYCTGSLIAPNVVLTAAHCVKKPIVSFRTTSTSPVPTISHDVIATKKHPLYFDLWCPNPTRDIALVRLAQPLTTTPLAFGAAPPAEGSVCTAIGFGVHATDAGTTERKRKRIGTSTIHDVSGGSIEVRFLTAVADSGDWGGPLLCNGNIVGTVGCHNDDEWPEHRFEYYERTDDAADWIRDVIDEWK